MKTITTTIRETVKVNGKGERKEVGKISFLVPTLEEVKDHLATEDALAFEKDGDKVLDSYESPFTQFINDAIESACRTKLTSKLIPQSVQFKAGQALWTNIAELCEVGSRGQHFVTLAVFKTAITAYVTGLKKSDGFKANVIGYLLTPKALAETSSNNKAVVEKILGSFLETLEQEEVDRFDKILTELGEAIAFQGNSLEDEA